jgi:hypothetical protein
VAKLFASIKKRWSALRRLPFLVSGKPAKSWRAKHYSLQLTRSRQLLITVRTFRTAKKNRAKSYKQLVIRTYLSPGGIREIAIRQKRIRVRRGVIVRRAMATAVLIAGVSGMVHFSMQLVVGAEAPPAPVSYSLPLPPENDTETEEVRGLEPSTPLTLRIDAIDLKSDILTVGKNADDSMETPPLMSDKAGWYRHGPTPGEIGPAIIVGHVDNLDGPSVFWRLGELKPGDKIKISREDGETVTFKVTRIQQFEQDNFPADKVYGNIGYAGLRLITCGGTFDASTGRYTHNTVVFASMVE